MSVLRSWVLDRRFRDASGMTRWTKPAPGGRLAERESPGAPHESSSSNGRACEAVRGSSARSAEGPTLRLRRVLRWIPGLRRGFAALGRGWRFIPNSRAGPPPARAGL